MAERKSARCDAVVLAAGAGRRFGGRKLLASFEGRPLAAGALDAAFSAPVERVLLVTDGDGDLAAFARDHARALGREADLEIVVTAHAAEGMGASLRAGVEALRSDPDGVFVFLGDMPRIPSGLSQALVRALAPDVDAVAPRFMERRGHPVLFGRACFPALQALGGDVGAREVLAALGDRLALVDSAEPGVLFDVDRPEDLA